MQGGRGDRLEASVALWTGTSVFVATVGGLGVCLSVAAASLAYAACWDASRRRIPRRTVALMAASLVARLVTSGGVFGESSTVLRALAASAAVLVILGGVWMLVPGTVAFGDVRLAALTGAAAACVSWSSFVTSMGAAVIAGGCLAAGRRAWRYRSAASSSGTMPFAPMLLVGLLVGVAP
jgi:hypothetical protein